MIKRIMLATLIMATVFATATPAGRLLEKRLIATRDFVAAPEAYSELFLYNLKAGQGDALMFRVEVTGITGGTTGLVIVPVPVWDTGQTADVTKSINFITANAATALDSVVTLLVLDEMYAFVWGDGLATPVMLPPYISFQTREDFTAGTLNVYVYLVAR